ncbi:MAG TPA: ammonia channel protein [Planctomycetaceae bacterium]|nr:ammonia channel protein [Planctomycetaceae bacterium]
MSRSLWLAFGILLVFAPASAVAEDATPVTLDDAAVKADTAWVLVCSALVLMMTAPGLALFYGGLVRKKNVLSVLMQCAALIGLMSVVWVVCGYSFAFGKSVLGGFIGGGDHLLLAGVLPEWVEGNVVVPMTGTLPTSVHMVFQMMFFVITPALICGAFAERMKFSAMCVFSVLWGLLVYCPLAHWVWAADGWLCSGNPDASFPLLDFAGGAVVHLSSGVAALVCCLLMGPRVGFGREAMPPHNLTYTAIGAALLWVGWFGFNAGSALGVNALAANAFVTTHLAGATGLLGWMAIEWIQSGRPTVLGACTGGVAGLACITPACGAVSPLSGLVIGLLAGLICYVMCTSVKNRLGFDDSLDVFGVHGTSGVLGLLMAGVLASPAVTGGEEFNGLVYGATGQFINQVAGILATTALAIVGTLLLLLVLRATIGLRVDPDGEREGLDLNQHGEEGYIFL